MIEAGSGTEAPAAPGGSRARALDRLAVAAVLLALVPIPILGIGNPVTHVLVFGIVACFGWLLVRPGRSVPDAIRALDLGWPGASRGWFWIVLAGLASGGIRLYLDEALLGGRGGIDFYQRMLRQGGAIGPAGQTQWVVLLAGAPILLLVILLDGVFFSGLIQTRLAAHTNPHAAVLAQAFLFALPHAFAGPKPDVAYGAGTFIAGVAYGYVYRSFRNHWVPASLLWTHVFSVWVILLLKLPRPA